MVRPALLALLIWPLEHASFVIHLPADVELLEFTFPFAACADSLPGAW